MHPVALLALLAQNPLNVVSVCPAQHTSGFTEIIRIIYPLVMLMVCFRLLAVVNSSNSFYNRVLIAINSIIEHD